MKLFTVRLLVRIASMNGSGLKLENVGQVLFQILKLHIEKIAKLRKNFIVVCSPAILSDS